MGEELEKYLAKKMRIEAEKKTVNKKKYLLITLLFGFFGGNKFYIGKYQLGILYLLISFTFLPLFIAVFEFITVCKMKADKDGNIRV